MLFPEEFIEYVLEGDLKNVSKKLKHLADLSKLLGGDGFEFLNVTRIQEFEKEDLDAIKEIKKLLANCKTDVEIKHAKQIEFLLYQIIYNLQIISKDSAREFTKQQTAKKIYTAIQEVFEEEKYLQRVFNMEIKTTTKKPLGSLAYFDPETLILKLHKSVEAKCTRIEFQKYCQCVKQHEITEHLMRSSPRRMKKYQKLAPIFKKYGPYWKQYNPDAINIYEGQFLLESHIIAVYEEFREAKKLNILKKYYETLYDLYGKRLDPHAQVVEGIWSMIYDLLK
jgi:hypothetical protein